LGGSRGSKKKKTTHSRFWRASEAIFSRSPGPVTGGYVAPEGVGTDGRSLLFKGEKNQSSGVAVSG